MQTMKKLTLEVNHEHLKRAIKAKNSINYNQRKQCLLAQAAEDLLGDQFYACGFWITTTNRTQYVSADYYPYIIAFDDNDLEFLIKNLPKTFEITEV